MAIRNVLWIDLETTGIKPEGGQILEVAAAVVAPDFSVLCWHIEQVQVQCDMPQELRAQHERSGLLEECRTHGVSMSDFELNLRKFVEHWFPDGRVIIAGDNVSFDRSWLEFYCPTVTRLFHYRQIDVTSLKLAKEVFGAPHRAVRDVERSMADCKRLLCS